ANRTFVYLPAGRRERIKQAAHITKLRPASLEHSKVAILMILILWVLIERNALAAEMFLSQKEVDMARYSIWSTSMFMFQRLKATLISVALAILPYDCEYALFYLLKCSACREKFT
ncbi:MAG: hypothetical protein FWG68_03280, partial [Defluviitaleaceae bacterium]|nr:hypothetical protein [Defluviitaleaceae bacterium]